MNIYSRKNCANIGSLLVNEEFGSETSASKLRHYVILHTQKNLKIFPFPNIYLRAAVRDDRSSLNQNENTNENEKASNKQIYLLIV